MATDSAPGGDLSSLLRSDVVIFIAAVASFLALWQATASGYDIADTISSPWLIANFMAEVLRTGEWVPHYAATLKRISYAFAFSMIVGVLLGIVMGITTFVQQVLKYYVLVGLAMPAVVAALFAAMWFGLTELTPMVATAVATVPFIGQSIFDSVEDIDSDLVAMSASFDVSRNRVIRRVVVQSVMPEIFGSLRFAFSVSWKITAITEVIISQTGVGYLIRINMNQLDMTGLLTYVLLFTIIVMVIEYGVFRKLEGWIFAWREDVSFGF